MTKGLSKLLKTQETADRLGMCKNTLVIWRSQGRVGLPFVRVGSAIRYREEDVEQFIENNLVGGKPDQEELEARAEGR